MQADWKVFACLAAALALLVRPGCSQSAEPGKNVITDQAGRQVKIPGKVKDVVCLWPESTCILRAIGAHDMVVGVDSRVSDHPVLARVWPQVKDLPVVGTMKSVNAEQLLALGPDLVIVSARSGGLGDQIEQYDIPVACFHPDGEWQQYLEEIRLVGRCVGRESAAKKLMRYLRGKMDAVGAEVEDIPRGHRPRAYVTFAYDPLRTTPLDSVELAGGLNLAEGDRGIWHTVGMEWLLARQPDVIVQHTLAKYELTDKGGGWQSLDAVKQGKIYRVLLGYCGVDPALYLQQVRQMSALFHPLEVPWAGNLEADGRTIFRDVYGRPEVFAGLAKHFNLTLEPAKSGAEEK